VQILRPTWRTIHLSRRAAPCLGGRHQPSRSRQHRHDHDPGGQPVFVQRAHVHAEPDARLARHRLATLRDLPRGQEQGAVAGTRPADRHLYELRPEGLGLRLRRVLASRRRARELRARRRPALHDGAQELAAHRLQPERGLEIQGYFRCRREPDLDRRADARLLAGRQCEPVCQTERHRRRGRVRHVRERARARLRHAERHRRRLVQGRAVPRARPLRAGGPEHHRDGEQARHRADERVERAGQALAQRTARERRGARARTSDDFPARRATSTIRATGSSSTSSSTPCSRPGRA